MTFVLVKNGVVIQKQPYMSEGFIEADDVVVCGWHYDGFVFSHPPKEPDAIRSEILQATQQRLDDFARTRNYNGILSLCTYATSTVPKFQAEGQYGVSARDATWAKLYEMLAEVGAGTRPMPTGYADIKPELPELTWP